MHALWFFSALVTSVSAIVCDNVCQLAVTTAQLEYPRPVFVKVQTVYLTTAVIVVDRQGHTLRSSQIVKTPAAPKQTLVWTHSGVALTWPTIYAQYTGLSQVKVETVGESCAKRTIGLALPSPTNWSPLILPIGEVPNNNAAAAPAFAQYINGLPTVVEQLGRTFDPGPCTPRAVRRQASSSTAGPGDTVTTTTNITVTGTQTSTSTQSDTQLSQVTGPTTLTTSLSPSTSITPSDTSTPSSTPPPSSSAESSSSPPPPPSSSTPVGSSTGVSSTPVSTGDGGVPSSSIGDGPAPPSSTLSPSATPTTGSASSDTPPGSSTSSPSEPSGSSASASASRAPPASSLAPPEGTLLPSTVPGNTNLPPVATRRPTTTTTARTPTTSGPLEYTGTGAATPAHAVKALGKLEVLLIAIAGLGMGWV